jgi:hypothetical protein
MLLEAFFPPEAIPMLARFSTVMYSYVIQACNVFFIQTLLGPPCLKTVSFVPALFILVLLK